MYPIFLKLGGRSCLVVGGGAVAKRKAVALLSCNAEVRMLAPKFDSELVDLSLKNDSLTLTKKYFEETDIGSAYIVIAATDDKKTNRLVFDLANKKGLLVNVVDEPELCNFYIPSTVRRGDLTIAISTGGASPALAKKIRQTLESQFDERYGVLLEALGEIRRELFEKYPVDVKRRGEILNKIVNSTLISNLTKSSKEELLTEMRKWI